MRDKILRTASHQRSQDFQLLKHACNETAKKIPGKAVITLVNNSKQEISNLEVPVWSMQDQSDLKWYKPSKITNNKYISIIDEDKITGVFLFFSRIFLQKMPVCLF